MNHLSSDPSSLPPGGAAVDAISRRAYEIWEQEGRPAGNDLQHWLRAELELNAERSAMDPLSRNEASDRLRQMADTRPLQSPPNDGAASRYGRRTSKPPFSAGTPNSSAPSGGKSETASRRR